MVKGCFTAKEYITLGVTLPMAIYFGKEIE